MANDSRKGMDFELVISSETSEAALFWTGYSDAETEEKEKGTGVLPTYWHVTCKPDCEVRIRRSGKGRLFILNTGKTKVDVKGQVGTLPLVFEGVLPPKAFKEFPVDDMELVWTFSVH